MKKNIKTTQKVHPFKATKTPWSSQDVTNLRDWHEARMKELNYPFEVRSELTQIRESFIMKLGRWMKK